MGQVVCIEGHRFDLGKTKHHWALSHWDGHNRHTGDLYVSSKGTWFVETPSQWGNGRRWEIVDPADALERYSKYLSEDEKGEILALAELETE